ncbi:MAG: ROK family protein [Algicola sp.]|nr:ROK family protein [Algicola sp.]
MICGIDIGGSKIELGVFCDQYKMQNNWRVPTPTTDYAAFIDVLVKLVKQADSYSSQASTEQRKQVQVGIGMAGLIDAQGKSLSANVPCATGKNIVKDLSARLNRPIAVENDCRCFALSEALGGAGEGFQNVFGAVIGTGSAGGLVINGQLYKSRQGIAGEYGHLQLPATLQQKYQLPRRPCGCGLPNCVEGFISGPGLLFLNRHFGGNAPSVPDLIESLRSGDPKASIIFDCYIDLLGASFAALILSYDPDIIVLGGGLSLIDEIVEQLPATIKPHLFAGFNTPTIKRAKFGDASGVRGAALLTLSKQALINYHAASCGELTH